MEMSYYEILGIEPSATKEEIRSAYLKAASKYHPDANNVPNASAIFKLVKEAYDTLYDDDKRKAYDANKSSSSNAEAKPEYDENELRSRKVTVIKKRMWLLWFALLPVKLIAWFIRLTLKVFFQAVFILSTISYIAAWLISGFTFIGGLFFLLEGLYDIYTKNANSMVTYNVSSGIILMFFGYCFVRIAERLIGLILAIIEILIKYLDDFLAYDCCQYIPVKADTEI